MVMHESMMPSNFTSSGGHDNQTWNNPFWAVIVFVIFVVIIALFWRNDNRKDGYGMESIYPALALGKLGKDGCGCEHRDLLKETGLLQKEIAMTAWQNDKSILENRHITALGFKEQEVLGLKSTADIMNRICTLENNLREDKLRAAELKLNNLETVISIRGLGSIPAYMQPNPYMPYACATA